MGRRLCGIRTDSTGPASHFIDLRGADSIMTSLDGRIAIVTGGGTGIGQGIALAFAKAGAKVIISGRRLEPLQETLMTIHESGGQGLLVQGDVSKESDVENLVRSTLEAY